MKKTGVKILQKNKQQIEENLILKKKKNILKDKKLKVKIIQYIMICQQLNIRKDKNNRVSNKKLLVARSNKKYDVSK